MSNLCCCFSVYTGALLAGSIDLTLSMMNIVKTVVQMIDISRPLIDNTEHVTNANMDIEGLAAARVDTGIEIGINLITCFFSLFLLLGLLKKNVMLIKVWMVFRAVATLTIAIYAIYLMVTGSSVEGAIWIIIAILSIYFLVVANAAKNEVTEDLQREATESHDKF